MRLKERRQSSGVSMSGSRYRVTRAVAETLERRQLLSGNGWYTVTGDSGFSQGQTSNSVAGTVTVGPPAGSWVVSSSASAAIAANVTASVGFTNNGWQSPIKTYPGGGVVLTTAGATGHTSPYNEPSVAEAYGVPSGQTILGYEDGTDGDYNDGYAVVTATRQTLDSLTLNVKDPAHTTNTATNGGTLYIEQNASDTAVVNLSGVLDQDSNLHKLHTLWKVSTTGAGGADPLTGNFTNASNSITLARDGTGHFAITAGFDANANNILDASEVMATVDVQLVRITQATFTDVNNSSMGSITATGINTDPVWVEGWHAGGAAISITTDLNVSAAAEQVLVKFTGMTSGSEQTLTLAEVQSASGRTLVDVGTRVTIGFDDNADGELNVEEIVTAAANNRNVSDDTSVVAVGGEPLAALGGLQEVFARIELFIGDDLDDALSGGIRPYDLQWLARYMAGTGGVVQIDGDLLAKYRADADVQAAEGLLRDQVWAQLNEQAKGLTQANPSATFDFTGTGKPVDLTDTIFSLGDGYLNVRAQGTMEAVAFDANGKATQYMVFLELDYFQRDFFNDPTNIGWEPGTEFDMNVDYEENKLEVRNVIP